MRDMDTTKRKLQNEIKKAEDENLKPTEEYRLAEAKFRELDDFYRFIY